MDDSQWTPQRSDQRAGRTEEGKEQTPGWIRLHQGSADILPEDEGRFSDSATTRTLQCYARDHDRDRCVRSRHLRDHITTPQRWTLAPNRVLLAEDASRRKELPGGGPGNAGDLHGFQGIALLSRRERIPDRGDDGLC